MNDFNKKVLFVGDGNPNGYIFMRSQSIKKLVQSMDMIDTNKYINPKNKIRYHLAYRFQLDFLLKDLNKAIIQMVNSKYRLDQKVSGFLEKIYA